MFDDEAGGFKPAVWNSMLNRDDIQPATKPARHQAAADRARDDA